MFRRTFTPKHKSNVKQVFMEGGTYCGNIWSIILFNF